MVINKVNTDTLTGFLGNDAFVINETSGSNDLNQVDRIIDFKLTEEVIELSANLTFEQLNLIQGTGQFSKDTLIQLKSNGQYLAILQGIQGTALERNDFV